MSMKSVITVPLPQQAYDVAIVPGGLADLGAWLASAPVVRVGQKLLVVSNPTVFELYGKAAIAALSTAGYQVETCLVPDGEQYKTLDSIQKIYDAALAQRLERGSAIVALGGGVIGDMAGFAAATWLRGIAVVQVPTTLLAMVDSSIGGKTGVNHPQGKNLIGAFHQPRFVLIDPTTLSTLPDREFRAGMAEVIKYGVIWDKTLFKALEAATIDRYSTLDPALLQTILSSSCQAKADVVAEDEKEAGLRAILNYGHTIGHAVESLTGYTELVHGEAVAIGMVAAGQIAVRLGVWSAESAARQDRLIAKAGLPTQIPAGLDLAAIAATLKTDKKVQDGTVRFVLPKLIGEAFVSNQVPEGMINQVLKHLTVVPV